MSKCWKIPLAYVLYGIGHGISRTILQVESESIAEAFYKIYNWLMCRSADLDEWNILWKPTIAQKGQDDITIVTNIDASGVDPDRIVEIVMDMKQRGRF